MRRLLLVLAACSSKHATPVPAEREACLAGDGKACFIAGARYSVDDREELETAIDYWTRGCELGHGKSCAQLGTVVEFGMAGRKSNPAAAMLFYARACRDGDEASCHPGKPSPDAKLAFPWREALTPVAGKEHATLGPIFADLVFGAPLTDPTRHAIADWEKKFHGRVHYYQGDEAASAFLEITFDETAGLYPVLVSAWGKPDMPWGAWTNAGAHVWTVYMHNERTSGISWSMYRSIDEYVLPAEPIRLGFEPILTVGGKLSDLQAALGERLHRTGETTYKWREPAPGPAVDVEVEVKGGAIVALTANMITNDPAVGDAIIAALAQKYGGGKSPWRRDHRKITATKPASGNLDLRVEKI